MVRNVEFGIFCLNFDIYLRKLWVRGGSYKLYELLTFLSEGGMGIPTGTEKQRPLLIAESLKSNLRGGKKYLTVGLTGADIRVYDKVRNGELPVHNKPTDLGPRLQFLSSLRACSTRYRCFLLNV